MMKTAKAIERDVFNIIKESLIGSTIKGTVYRKGIRPPNVDTEDVVVKFLSGLDEQVQKGVVIVNIYVPDIILQGHSEKVEDIKRIEIFQELATNLLETLTDTEYQFEKDGTPVSLKAEGIEQHFVNLRIKFKRITI